MKDSVTVDGVEYFRRDTLDEEDREGNPFWPWVIGAQYMIRTVTMHDHGTLVGVTDKELVLKKAAWIADSGRWWDFLSGKAAPNEVEPFGEEKLVIVSRGVLIDAVQLPGFFKDQK